MRRVARFMHAPVLDPTYDDTAVPLSRYWLAVATGIMLFTLAVAVIVIVALVIAGFYFGCRRLFRAYDQRALLDADAVDL